MANEGVNLATAHTAFTADFSNLTEGIKHAVKLAQDGANRIKQEFAEIEKAGQRASRAFSGDFTANINLTVRTVQRIGSALRDVAGAAVKTGATIGTALSGGIRSALSTWNSLHGTFIRTMSQMRMRLVFFKLDLEFLATGVRRLFLGIGAALSTFSGAAITFESAFVTIRRVVDETEAGFAQLNQNIRQMSKELPIGANELANLMSVAGRLGIRGVDNLTKFTETIARLQMTTDIVGEAAASDLARLLNVMDELPSNIDRVGSTIVDLGNNFAATEMEIINMATRLAGAGRTVGLTTSDVLGLATALAQAGVRAEMGGSAISRVMINMAQAVANGTKEVATFAKVSGMTTGNWAEQFRSDPIRAIEAFIRGLRRMDDAGKNVFATLEAVGMTEIRTRDALLRLIGASEKMTDAIERSNRAWQQNVALTNEVEKALDTTGAQSRLLWNELIDIARGIGDQLQPVLRNLIDVARTVASVFENLTDEQKKNIAQWTVLAGVIAGVGMALMTAVHIILTTVLSLVLIVQALTMVTNPLFIGFMAILLIVGLVKKAFEENWGGIATKFENFTQRVKEAFDLLNVDQLVAGISSAIDDLKAIWASDLTFGEKIVETGKVVVKIGKTLWQWAKEASNTLLDAFLARWGEEGKDFENMKPLEKTLEAVKVVFSALVNGLQIVWGGLISGYNTLLDWFLNNWDEEVPEDEQPRTTLEKTLRVGQITLSAIVNAVKIGWEWLKNQYDSVLDMLLAYWGMDDEEIENLTLPQKTIKAVSLVVTQVVGLVESIVGWFLNATIDLVRNVAVTLGIDWENSYLGKVLDQIQKWWNDEEVTLTEKTVGLVGISIAGVYIVQGTRALAAMIGAAISKRLGLAGAAGSIGAVAKGFAVKVLLPAVAIAGLGLVFMEPEAIQELRDGVQKAVDALNEELEGIWDDLFADLNAAWKRTLEEGRIFDPLTIIVQNVADTLAAVRQAIQPVKEFLENKIAENLGKINLAESFRKGMESGELDVDPRVVGFFSSLIELGKALADMVKEGFLLGFDLLLILVDIFLVPITGIAATIMDVGAQLAGQMIAGFQEAWEEFSGRFVRWFKNSPLGRLLISLGFIEPDAKDADEQAGKMSPEDRAALSGLQLQASLIEREMMLDANRDRLDELSQQLAEIEAQIESILSKYVEAVKPEGIAFVRAGETVLTEYSSAQIEAMVRSIAEKSGYGPDLAVAMAMAESTLRDVINPEGIGWGPLQVTDQAIADLQRLGYSVDMDTIEGRIQAGLDYINVLLTQYADTVQGLADRLSISLHDAVILAYLYGPGQSKQKQTLTDADRKRLERAYGMQHGGIMPGLAGADQYHVMVAPGEAIVPSQAVRRGWPGVLEWFRKKRVPGFQAGFAPNVPSSIATQINPTMEAAVQLRDSVQEMSKSLVDALERSIGWLGGIFMSGIELLVKLLENLFPEQADAFRDVIEGMKNLWSAMWERDTRSPVPEELLHPPVPAPPPRPEPILTPWERLVKRVQEIWGKSVDWVKARWGNTIAWFEKRLEKGVSFISEAKEWFGKPLEEQIEDVKNAFATGALFILDAVESLPGLMRNVANGIAIFSETLMGKVPGLSQALNTFERISETQPKATAGTVAMLELLEANSKELAASLGALMVPVSIVARAFGDSLAPALEALFPVFKFFAQTLLTVIQGVAGVWNAIVGTIGGIFGALSDISILGFRPLGFLGGIADFFDSLKLDTKTLSDAQRELAELTWEQAKATDEATRNIREMAANVPSIFKRALRVFQSSEGIPGLATGGYVPATPGGRIVRLAERGQGEYVIPERRMGAFGGTSFVVNVDMRNSQIYGVDDLDNRIKRNVGEALRDATSVLTGA